MPISTYTDGVGDALRSIGDYATGLVTPTVRLGVTGLARSGKTVFITALVHNLDRRRAASLLRRRRPRAACSAPISSRSPTTACRDSTTSSISPISPAIRRAGRRAPGASASCASRSNTTRGQILEAAARPRPAAHRHRRLSWRMAARPAAARASTIANGRARPLEQAGAPQPQEGRQGVAQGTRRDRSDRPRRRGARAKAVAICSSAICSDARAPTRMRCRRCRPGRFLHAGRARGLAGCSPSPRSMPARRRASRAARCGR